MKKKDFPNAEKYGKTSISLPVHPFINDKMIKTINSIIQKKSEVKTRIMELGLRDDICQPVYPLLVRVQIAEAFSSLAILAAWKQTDWPVVCYRPF